MNTLDTYVDDLLEAKGYKDAAPEVKEVLKKDLAIRIDEFIMARNIAELTDEELREFEKLLDENKSRAELQQFAMDHIPDYHTFLTATLVEFQDLYLAQY